MFISVGGSVSMCFTMTTPTVDYSFVGPRRVEGHIVVCCGFDVAMILLLRLCVC